MTAAPAPALSPSRFAPFLLASPPSPSRAWMARPATVHADGLAWTIATDGASLYAEPGEQGHPLVPDERAQRVIEEMCWRARSNGLPLHHEDRELLRRRATKPTARRDGLDAVLWGTIHYDARRVLAALDALSWAPRLLVSLHACVAPKWRGGAGPADGAETHDAREILFATPGGTFAALMNC